MFPAILIYHKIEMISITRTATCSCRTRKTRLLLFARCHPT